MVHFPRMDTRIARRLMQKKKRLDAYGPLPPLTVERIHEDLRVLLTYHSNAIEGNTLPLAETQIVLAYGITVNEHPCSFIEGKRGAITSSAREMCHAEDPLSLAADVFSVCSPSVGRTCQASILEDKTGENPWSHFQEDAKSQMMCISRAIPLAHLHQWDPTGLLPTQMGMAID